MRKAKILLIIFLLNCNKNIKELINKNKIGSLYWQYIEDGKFEELEEYIKGNNIDINKEMNENGEIALTLATKLNKGNIIKFLLNLENIDVNAKNKVKKTALIVSIIDAPTNFMKYGIIDDLLDKGANVNISYGIKGNNALMLAIFNEDFHIANKILNERIDINYQNLSKETALILTIKSKTDKIDKKEELIYRLLKFEEIDINLKDKDGKTAIKYAIADNNFRTIDIFLKTSYRNLAINELLETGADVNNKYTTKNNNLLMLAIEEGKTNIIEKILIKGVEINYQNLLGETALMLAIKNKNIKGPEKIKILEFFLEYEEINLNLKDEEGKTALMQAVIDNNLIIIDKLLNKEHIKLNLVDKEGMTPFDHLDFKNFKIEVALCLIKNGALSCHEIFNKKAKESHLEDIMKLLIDSKEDTKSLDKNLLLNLIIKLFNNETILSLKLFHYFKDEIELNDKSINEYLRCAQLVNSNIFHFLNFINNKKYNLSNLINENLESKKNIKEIVRKVFFDAVLTQNTEIIKKLIKRGFNVNSKDKDGNTSIIYAAKYGHENVIELLIKAGANVNSENGKGNTAISYAIKNNYENIVRLLIEERADAFKEIKGEKALIYAVKKNYENIVKMLIEAGADVNYEDGNGNTAISYAIKNNYENIVRILIKAGADAFKKINEKETLTYEEVGLIYAIKKNYENIVKILIKVGADVNYKDGYGNTAIICATAYGYENIIRILIRAGAFTNFKNKQKNTAIIYAAAYGYENIIRILIRAGADVNYKDGYGNTAIDYASEHGYENIIKLLIKAGAHVNPKNNCKNVEITYELHAEQA